MSKQMKYKSPISSTRRRSSATANTSTKKEEVQWDCRVDADFEVESGFANEETLESTHDQIEEIVNDFCEVITKTFRSLKMLSVTFEKNDA